MSTHDRTIRRRRTAAVVAALALAGLMAAPAGAQSYVPEPGIFIDDPVAEPGSTIPIAADGFLPDADVDIYVSEFRPIPDNDDSDEENLEDLSQTVEIPLINLDLVASPASTGPAAASFAVAGSTPAVATFAAVTLQVIPLGSTTTDATGSFRFDWNTGGYPEGIYGVIATDGVNTALVRVTVDQAAFDAAGGGGAGAGDGSGGSGSGSLPQTGGVNQLPLRVGALLLAAGGIAVLVGRRRRSHGFTTSG
jgi:LPXTG-motif cell wall-anchored protein